MLPKATAILIALLHLPVIHSQFLALGMATPGFRLAIVITSPSPHQISDPQFTSCQVEDNCICMFLVWIFAFPKKKKKKEEKKICELFPPHLRCFPSFSDGIKLYLVLYFKRVHECIYYPNCKWEILLIKGRGQQE